MSNHKEEVQIAQIKAVELLEELKKNKFFKRDILDASGRESEVKLIKLYLIQLILNENYLTNNQISNFFF
jgi:hypothetical protein